MENQGLLRNARFIRTLILLIVSIIIFAAVNIVGGESFFKLSTNFASPVAAFVVALLAYQAYNDKRAGVSRYVWLGMAIGFGLYCIADSLWVVFSLVFNDDVPYPSIADLAWLIGYIPLSYALLKRLKTLKVEPSMTQVHFLRTFGAIWLIVTFVFVLLPIISTLEFDRAIEGFVSILYPLADMLLGILSCQILVLMHKGRFSLAWRLIFAGLLLMAFSDSVYSYATWYELYYPESGLNLVTILIDLTYIFSYVLVALGIYVYRITWEIKDAYTLSLETMPSARYYTFIGTNKENKIISLSDNFYYLTGAKADSVFLYEPLDQALGVNLAEVNALNALIAEKEFLVHHPYTVYSADHRPVDVWITAKAFYDTDKTYNGASLAFTADLPAPEDLRLPRNKELLSMMNYLISLAGSRPKDEIQTIRAYFLEMIRMLSSMLFHFGGPEFKHAFFAHLEQIIRKENLPIKLSNDVITVTEEYEGVVLATALLPILQAARAYVCDLVGERAVNEEIEDLEKQLDSTALRDLDKYHLRVFHPA